jgi:hypothetical protein
MLYERSWIIWVSSRFLAWVEAVVGDGLFGSVSLYWSFSSSLSSSFSGVDLEDVEDVALAVAVAVGNFHAIMDWICFKKIPVFLL